MAGVLTALTARAAPCFSLALLLTAPALLYLGAGIVCPGADCRPGAFDQAGLALAARGQAPLTDAIFRAVTWAGSIFVLGPLALLHAGFAWCRLRSAGALFLPVALAGAVLLAYGAKLAVARARPDVAALIDMPASASFPSAHALQASAFVLAWLLAPSRRTGRPAAGEMALGLVAVLLVAWSRLHLQVHYPSDILYALAAGTVWAVTLRQLAFWAPMPSGAKKT